MCNRICMRWLCGIALALAAPLPAQAETSPASAVTTAAAPQWVLELKGGMFEPDLDDYSQYYGDSDVFTLAFAGAWRFSPWLELGAEAGYMKDTGAGTLANSETPGGRVEYTLVPLQLYVNLRYDRTPDQLLVPYIGAGLAAAWYRQEIAEQSTRTGFSDIGGAARAGLQLSLNRLSPGTRTYATGDRVLQSYIFIEGQHISTKKDGSDLGGDSYLLGLRLEF